MLFLAAVTFLVISAAACSNVPPKCDALDTSIDFTNTLNKISLKISYHLAIEDNDEGWIVNVTNIRQSSPNTTSTDFAKLKAVISGDDVDCTYTSANDCYFIVQNSTLFIYAEAKIHKEDMVIQIFQGVVNEGGFSNADGEVFDKTRKCRNATEAASGPDDDDNYSMYSAHCCSNLIKMKAPSYQKKCMSFESRSTIYNTNDNYSIYESAKFLFTLNNNSQLVIWRMDGDNGCIISLNDDRFTRVGQFSGDVFGLMYDDEVLLFSALFDLTSPNDPTSFSYRGLAGRLLLRNEQKQTLMDNDNAFSQTHNCQYFSEPLVSGKTFSSQFCCTKFNS